MATKSKKQEYIKRGAELKRIRKAGWDPLWMDIGDNILPRRGRFFTNETNRADLGTDRKRRIIDSAPTIAARTLRSLMMNGMCSPSRRWFIGGISDQLLKESQAVKDWCFAVETWIRDTVKKSNLYQCLDNVMGDVGSFGTSVLYVEDDPEQVVRGYVFPIGSYSLASSSRLVVDTCYREVQLTVRQLVDQFGEENCSTNVQNAFKQGDLEQLIDVTHLIQPNADYEPGKLGPAGMKFHSCWFETASANSVDEKFLREGGYAEDPLMKVRWNVLGEDTYGSDCPGFEAIGDAKVLQLTCRREEQAFDKVVNPPMAAPTSLIGQRSSTLAGDITHVDTTAGGQRYEAAVVINPVALQAFANKIERLKQGVRSAYYADLALMFQQLESGKMTATEVDARQREQMMLLGSVSERSEEELLRPLLYRVFMIGWRNGLLPEPPEELRGAELKFDFVSVIQQAQKILSTTNLERLLSLVGNLSGVFPDAKDKIDADQAIDEYGDAIAIAPNVIRSDDEVAAIRAARAKQQEMAAQAQQAAAAAQGAKVLSEADTGGDNALTRLLGNTTGGPAPGALN